MKMKYSFFVCLNNLFRKKHTLCKVFWNLPRYKISLCWSNVRIFIGVFLHYVFVAVFYKAHNRIIRSICTANHFSCISVNYILFSQLKFSLAHELLLYHILNVLNHHVVHMLILNSGNDRVYLFFIDLFAFIYFCISFLNCNNNFIAIILNYSAIPLNYLHHISSNLNLFRRMSYVKTQDPL